MKCVSATVFVNEDVIDKPEMRESAETLVPLRFLSTGLKNQ